MKDTQGVLNGMNSWCICHVRRNANYVAHSLAKTTVKQIIDDVYTKEFSSYICDIILLVQFALSF